MNDDGGNRDTANFRFQFFFRFCITISDYILNFSFNTQNWEKERIENEKSDEAE